MRARIPLSIEQLLVMGICCVAFQTAGIAPVRAEQNDQTSNPKFAKWLKPMDWRRDSEEPVIKIGEKGQFDDQHLFAPNAIMVGDEYWLYYSGSQNDVIAKGIYKPANQLTEAQKARIRRIKDKDRLYKVGLAKSKDGVHFQKYAGSPVLDFGDDRKGIVTPSMMRDGDGAAVRERGKLVMYFTGVDMPGNYKHDLYRATSEDGLKWSPPSPLLLENAYACHVMKDGDAYRMWFVDVGKRPWVIRNAESRDGLQWTVAEKPCLVPQEQAWERGDKVLVYPSVLKQDGIFIMLYGSYWDGPEKTAIGLAVSEDGKNWTRFAGNPVFKPEPKHYWEANFTTSQTFMKLKDGSYRLWYASRKKPESDGEPGWASMYYAIGTAHWTGPEGGD
ncbi:MAG: hypothetical protein IT426_01195 [Pirellulales bacterium]|nr:hypothetical protein [Pirellulales bacterium]